MAYVYSEQDDFDLTYFYDYHMRKIIQALNDFEDYIREKVVENKFIEQLLDKKFKLNDRQKELLRYFLVKGKNSYITPSSYISLYKVSRMTSASDLRKLRKMGLVTSKRVGRNIRYSATGKLRQNVKI